METLELLATVAGAGLVGSLLFSGLRLLFPAPAQAPANRLVFLWYWLLWAPQGARVSAFALSALASVAFGALLAAAQGEAVMPALLAAIDRMVAAGGVAQLVHLPQLPQAMKTAPEPTLEARYADH